MQIKERHTYSANVTFALRVAKLQQTHLSNILTVCKYKNDFRLKYFVNLNMCVVYKN